jgi:hypothetical protein
MLDILSVLAVAGIAIGMMIAARRLEPHWVSKDQRRFICRARAVDDHGTAIGGWSEYRFGITDDGLISGRKRSMWGAPLPGLWRVDSSLPDPPARRQIFVLVPDTVNGQRLWLKLPARSVLVPKMMELAEVSGPRH